MRKFSAGLVVVLLVVLLAGPVRVAPLISERDSPSTDAGPPASAKAVTVMEAESQAGSPVPDQQLPSPAAARIRAWADLEHAMRHDHEGLVEQVRPSGRRAVDLDGRFTQMAVAVRDPYGRLRLRCFSDFEALRKFLENPPPANQTPTHEESVPY